MLRPEKKFASTPAFDSIALDLFLTRIEVVVTLQSSRAIKEEEGKSLTEPT